jgi:hypothetical protein
VASGNWSATVGLLPQLGGEGDELGSGATNAVVEIWMAPMLAHSTLFYRWLYLPCCGDQRSI